MKGPVVAAAFLMVAGVATVTAGVVFARKVVRWSWPYLTPVLGWNQNTVTLPSNPFTRYPGTYGLRSEGGHARIGAVLSDTGRTVTRQVEAGDGSIRMAPRAAFDGDIHATPAELGRYENVSIQTPLGIAPAWQFGPAASEVWIIHIHGFQADRNNALRSVAALNAIPATHLVVSYRGDGEGPAAPGGVARLGLDEWTDVDAALSYAAEHGARRVILCGWSMGATIALLIGERSHYRDLVVAQVLISPATDWIAIIQAGAKQMGIPCARGVAWYVALFLKTPLLSRLVGLPRPINFNDVNWTTPGRVRVPTLAIHSAGDLTIPIETTRRFVAASPLLVELVETTKAAHTRELNVDTSEVSETMERWVWQRLAQAPGAAHRLSN